MAILFLFSLLFLLMFTGVLITISLGLSSVLATLLFSPGPVCSLTIKPLEISRHYTLPMIPFFPLPDAFVTAGGVAQRLIDFTDACVEHIRGSLAIATVLTCMLFATLSGSLPAMMAAADPIAAAGIVRSGYPQTFNAGIVCSANTLGTLIPPLIVIMACTTATETSVGKLFMADTVLGPLLGLILMVMIYIVARVRKLPAMPRASLRGQIASARKAPWGLLLMATIFGGTYLDTFTPTEAVAIVAVCSTFVALLVYKDIHLKECPKVLLESDKLTAMLIFITASTTLFTHILTTERIPQSITAWITDLGLSPQMFLLTVNTVLPITGNFVKPSTITLVLASIFFPTVMELGIGPVHFGIIMVVDMEISLVTPLVSPSLFATSAVTGMSPGAAIHAALPWLVVLLVFLIVMTYIPVVSVTLLDWLGMS